MPVEVEPGGQKESCTNPDCRVSNTGQCFEGLELIACPHFGSTDNVEETEKQDNANPVVTKGTVSLPLGTALSCDEASKVLLRSTESRVVAIIGPPESGKTSLIAGVYELFQSGTVDNIRFSRSETLIAFEQICHDARSESRRNQPHTERTSVGEVTFFHLEIACGNQPISVLLADRSGEEYRSATDDIVEVEGLVEIARADSISILVDGEKLLDRARHNMMSELKMLLQALKDGNGLINSLSLGIVLTKLDAVLSSDQRKVGMRVFQNIVEEITRLFGDSFATIEVFKVAASPKTLSAAIGEGLNDLLTFWMGNRRIVKTDCGNSIVSSRAFGRLRTQTLENNDES